MTKAKARTSQNMTVDPEDLEVWERVGDDIGCSRRYGGQYRTRTAMQCMRAIDELPYDHEIKKKLRTINAYK